MRHKLTDQGLSPDSDKVCAVCDMLSPNDKSGMQ